MSERGRILTECAQILTHDPTTWPAFPRYLLEGLRRSLPDTDPDLLKNIVIEASTLAVVPSEEKIQKSA